jgi:hypothetical protein|tara:strand:- start:1865 stop:2173 length:309 start_codon:yes stop_codon:yes gene_type:complete
MGKYKRGSFSEMNIVNGVNEVDMPMNGFNTQVFNLKPTLYQVTESDIQRPEMISYKVYNSMDMWWLLMKYNKVEDIWNDLFVGMVLEVPPKKELEAYYRSRR